MNDLYLSRLTLPVRTRLINHIDDYYSIHQFIYGLFPQERERKFLYRTDFDNLGNLALTIQSSVYPADPAVGEIRTNHIPLDFLMQDRYFFRLRFAPVVKSDGKVIRVDSKTEKAVGWLTQRANRIGVAFEEDSLDKESSFTFKMRPGNGRGTITISSVDIIGVFDVTERDSFIDAIKQGIGPYKGFGMGLMQLKPIKED